MVATSKGERDRLLEGMSQCLWNYNGTDYSCRIIDLIIDCSNTQEDRLMVVYMTTLGATWCREYENFIQNFKRIEGEEEPAWLNQKS